MSDSINKEIKSTYTLITPFHRGTVAGRDVYVGVRSSITVKMPGYIFLLGSYAEARTLQSAYIQKFEAKQYR